MPYGVRFIGDGSEFVMGVPAADHEVETKSEANKLVKDYPHLYKLKASKAEADAPKASKPRKAKAKTTTPVAATTPADAPQNNDTPPAEGEGA